MATDSLPSLIPELIKDDGTSLPDIHMLPIDTGISFAWSPDFLAHNMFRSRELELLLDQAADYLDRALQERAAWQDLGEKLFNLLQREKEQAELTAIAEIESQQFDIAVKEAFDEANGAKILTDGLFKKASNQFEIAQYCYGDLRTGAIDGDLGGEVEPIVNGTKENRQKAARSLTVVEAAKDAAVNQATWDYYQGYWNFDGEYYLAQNQGESLKRRIPTLWERHEFSKKRVACEARRRQLAEELLRVEQEARGPGKLLNFEERRRAIRLRYMHDFGQAMARMMFAEVGLRQVFAYSDPLPPPPPLGNSYEFYDQCLLWTRKAISWVVWQSRRDHTVVSTVSLKTKGDWKVDSEVKFRLDPQVLGLQSNARLVRLRGVGVAYATTMAPSSNFDVLSGVLTFKDSSNSLLVRIMPRTIVRDPEISGTSVLRNMIPFGEWELSLSKHSALGRPVSELVEDVWLDIHYVFSASADNSLE